jgi:hypothetical protein
MTQQIELKVNEKRIPLSEFPEEFMKNTLIGMISTLKGVDENIETIYLKMSNK